MSDLTVISIVANDNGLADIMVESVLAFTDPKPKIMLGDNGGNGDLYKRYENHPYVEVVRLNTEHHRRLAGGSNLHGWALNTLVPLSRTPRTAIIESDCAVLHKGWDNLKGHKLTAAVKAQTGNSIVYHVCAMVFETSALRANDWMPGTAHTQSANKSYKPHEDCGWQVGLHIKPEDVQLMDFVDTKTGNGQILDAGFCSDEFWLDGKPTFAHYGRGSNIAGKRVRAGYAPHKEQLEQFKQTIWDVIDGKLKVTSD